jgi:hypothetical protein
MIRLNLKGQKNARFPFPEKAGVKKKHGRTAGAV